MFVAVLVTSIVTNLPGVRRHKRFYTFTLHLIQAIEVNRPYLRKANITRSSHSACGVDEKPLIHISRIGIL